MGLFRYILGGESRRNLRKLDSMADKVLALQEKYEKFSLEECYAMLEEILATPYMPEV